MATVLARSTRDWARSATWCQPPDSSSVASRVGQAAHPLVLAGRGLSALRLQHELVGVARPRRGPSGTPAPPLPRCRISPRRCRPAAAANDRLARSRRSGPGRAGPPCEHPATTDTMDPHNAIHAKTQRRVTSANDETTMPKISTRYEHTRSDGDVGFLGGGVVAQHIEAVDRAGVRQRQRHHRHQYRDGDDDSAGTGSISRRPSSRSCAVAPRIA